MNPKTLALLTLILTASVFAKAETGRPFTSSSSPDNPICRGWIPRRVHDRATKLFGDEKVVYIKVAKGSIHLPLARGVGDDRDEAGWTRNTEKNPEGGSRVLQPILDQYEAVEAAPQVRVGHLLLDAGRARCQRGRACRLQEVAPAIDRQPAPRLEAPDMKIVIGRIGTISDRPSCVAVRQAQREIVDEDAHGAWVDVDDLNDREVDGKIESAVPQPAGRLRGPRRAFCPAGLCLGQRRRASGGWEAVGVGR